MRRDYVRLRGGALHVYTDVHRGLSARSSHDKRKADRRIDPVAAREREPRRLPTRRACGQAEHAGRQGCAPSYVDTRAPVRGDLELDWYASPYSQSMLGEQLQTRRRFTRRVGMQRLPERQGDGVEHDDKVRWKLGR